MHKCIPNCDFILGAFIIAKVAGNGSRKVKFTLAILHIISFREKRIVKSGKVTSDVRGMIIGILL